MGAKKQLHIIFKNKEDKFVTIRIDNPKEDVNKDNIEDVSLTISENNIFGEDLIPVRAEIIETTTETMFLND